MVAAQLNISTEQGADYGPLTLTWHDDGEVIDGVVTPGDPIDLSDTVDGSWSAKLQVRSRRDPDPAKALLFLTASSEAGHIDLLEDPEGGRISIMIPGDLTEGIVKGSAHYDLKLYSPAGDEHFVLYGKVTNRIRVTTDDD